MEDIDIPILSDLDKLLSLEDLGLDPNEMANDSLLAALSSLSRSGNGRGTNGSSSNIENIIGKASSAIGGMSSIFNTAANATKINEDQRYNNAMDQLRGAGTHGYSDYGQIISEQQSLLGTPRSDYDTVRGMTTGQKIGSIGSGLTSGATAGMQVAGPIGAIVGGVIGGLGAGAGVWLGDREAKNQVERDNMNGQIAMREAGQNYDAALENISKNNAIQSQVNSIAKGGSIKRQYTGAEYASKVLGNRSIGFRPTRQYCKGGVKVRIKVK